MFHINPVLWMGEAIQYYLLVTKRYINTHFKEKRQTRVCYAEVSVSLKCQRVSQVHSVLVLEIEMKKNIHTLAMARNQGSHC